MPPRSAWVGAKKAPERLIFKTPNSRLWERSDFTRDFIRFVESGARRMVDAGHLGRKSGRGFYDYSAEPKR